MHLRLNQAVLHMLSGFAYVCGLAGWSTASAGVDRVT